MATRLVEEMSDTWKPAQYKDTYHDDLMRLIDKRIKAGKTEVITRPTKDRGRAEAGPREGRGSYGAPQAERAADPKAKQPPHKSDRQCRRKTA